jgi:nitroimidazol reductase NimA-like FMN-containing flavoprotein (pyridoxamine 5'-phosphate oxidase superfamily)
MNGDTYPSGPRSALRRHPERGSHARADVDAILDAGLVCHVGVAVDGQPAVAPMSYARDGGRLILHGAHGSRIMRALADGSPVCVAVTHLDGVVVAHTAFDSSMNYRSAVVFGRGRAITDPAAKRRALDILTDRLIPGRAAEVPPPTDAEVAATAVVEIVIEEASAKTRTGPPSAPPRPLPDGPWTGVVPLHLAASEPDPAAGAPAELPASVRRLLAARRCGMKPPAVVCCATHGRPR